MVQLYRAARRPVLEETEPTRNIPISCNTSGRTKKGSKEVRSGDHLCPQKAHGGASQCYLRLLATQVPSYPCTCAGLSVSRHLPARWPFEFPTMYARYSQFPRSPAVCTAVSAGYGDRPTAEGTHVFLGEADKAVARPYAAQEIELTPGRVSLRRRRYVSGATRGRVAKENGKLTSPVRNTSRTRSLAPNFCTRAHEWYTIASRLPGSVSRSVSAYSRCPTPSGMYPRDGLPGGSGAASV